MRGRVGFDGVGEEMGGGEVEISVEPYESGA